MTRCLRAVLRRVPEFLPHQNGPMDMLPIRSTSSVCFFLTIFCSQLTFAAEIDFDTDIRPILSDKCFNCHGPSDSSRQADLRLDLQAGLFGEEGNTGVVVPGKPDESELLRRVESTEDYEQMPPPDSPFQLTAVQKSLLREWIAQGAPWEDHWSFQKIEAPEIPSEHGSWGNNPIDAFVLRKLNQRGMQPSPQQDKAALLRRLKFDLTGLPPTLQELDQFLADDSPEAYEKMVEQFLALPAFGERMAWHWLDIARYADTNGYQGDRERTMWPWRDWVIRSFNDNMPYDRFTVYQLAGDLLPDATEEQKLATGFHRNHMINGEGGRIAEENRVEYVFDQTETTGTVWLGLTLTCCRCHNHKYDQLTKEEYFQFYDFFNQSPVTGAGGDPQMAPNMKAPTPEQKQRYSQLSTELAQTRQQIKLRREELKESQPDWETKKLARLQGATETWMPLMPLEAKADHQELTIESHGAVLASGENPANDSYEVIATPLQLPAQPVTTIRLDAMQHNSMTDNGLARSNSGNFVLTDFSIKKIDSSGMESEVQIVSGLATFEQGHFKIKQAFDDDPASGWAVYAGKPIDQTHSAIFTLAKPLELDEGDRLKFVLKHDSSHASHNIGYFRLAASGKEKPSLAATQLDLLMALQIAPETRSESQKNQIETAFINSDDTLKNLQQSEKDFEKKLDTLRRQIPVVMVMEDKAERRQTLMLEKGIYNKTEGPAEAAFPAVLSFKDYGKETEEPLNRLDLAQWLVDPAHPLTARVTVNRFWQLFFGQGLVSTPEDFGVQGAKPTHPELLDWLASDFIQSGWDVKRHLKQIVMSATYRQSSRITPAAYEQDPKNKWLGRGPRRRLPSWMIRDHALATSGLLNRTIGGPPVNPYQPEGIWAEATFGKKKYRQDSGDKLYRRTLYTFWRRIVGPTMLFDNSPRQSCSVQVYQTNTPLHALVTLNDITYVEAARVFAQRVMQEETETEARLKLAMRLATSRAPEPEELNLLTARHAQLHQDYTEQPEAAHQLLTTGESPAVESLDAVELAAWTGVCSLILNLDEAINR